ncbi:MAG: hypothetical protein K2L56_00215 [Prevotella sp.]|nr:hypothetical protein [Prevotella sp.]
MKQEQCNYEEWLTTISNTRLIYNTISELEDTLDNHSIHSNGIKRSFTTPQRLRAAFRDLKEETALMTDDFVSLDWFMTSYKAAWTFYRNHLSRRTSPEQIAHELLVCRFHPDGPDAANKKAAAIYEHITDHDISLSIVIMLLMKALPGYDSKGGDVTDITGTYDSVLNLLAQFGSDLPFIESLPLIAKARNEESKSRIKLYAHVSNIIHTIEAYAKESKTYDMSTTIKEISIPLDLNGFWNECGGTTAGTDFWQIWKASVPGTYFAIKWHKDADNRLTGIKYCVGLTSTPDGRMTVYIIHPLFMKHKIQGKPWGDIDHVWYTTDVPDSDRPLQLPLLRIHPSAVWPGKIMLTRVEESETTDLYERWLDHCETEMQFPECDYEFRAGIHAITNDAIYVMTDVENEYFRIPKDGNNGFDKIKIDDNVGLMVMNNHKYLAFDEFLLYISTSKKSLAKYGIKRVREIS